ncbi:3-isopropylmalate dehydratase large subunit [Paraburkholderia humisilvae]|uniref:2,3-dimethylmalate dehydratase large subunit n=1 Tax=Paraburkholderia humisilvae TaxID=627669 RepID=A0A6J5EK47_9BURK|nr:aconitase family protein [Paraburkholderia humisilvae]CAB3766930.1 2,3-dimethylmalate dehydratase large subunit [Paraburkholderia humisilvae]
MGFTITEKIMARASGRAAVKAGDEVMVKPDYVLAYDFPGYTNVYFRQMKQELGIARVEEPDRFGIFIDHMVPAATTEEEAFHIETRQWTAQNSVPLFERKGIGHQVAAEVGYAVPGALVVHFDPHVSQLGTFGTLAFGIHRNMLEAFSRDHISLRVPHSVRVDLKGSLRPGVMARDVFHHIVRQLGSGGCRFKVLELAGPGLHSISIEGLQTITGLAMFTGALSAIVNPNAERLAYALPLAKKQIEPLSSDEDASYAAIHEIDLSTIEPIVVVPPSPANTRSLQEFIGLPVQAGYLGSCASGRLEDLRAAADVLRGRHVAEGFGLNIVPTSQKIMLEASREGLLTALVEAGAFLSSPSCDYCYGRLGTIAAGQRAVSTGTLNVPGRMGSPDAEIYLCNAAAVAASAIEGCIADPRKYL